MNVHMGKDENIFGLHNLPNRNNDYLAEVSLDNSFSCLKSELEKAKGNYKLTSNLFK